MLKVSNKSGAIVSNRNTRARCEICSKLTIKTPERRQWRSGVFIVNFEHISHLVLVFLLLTLSRFIPTGMKCVNSFQANFAFLYTLTPKNFHEVWKIKNGQNDQCNSVGDEERSLVFKGNWKSSFSFLI